jgi:Na+-transporting NADH:ubiquinone oxidoreductase subunit NqrC
VLVILVLLAAMSIIVIANTHTLHALKQELQLLDQRQNQRLNAGPGR